ncbi:MAG: hypothetical protein Q9160_003979 [Pyrenula sp. 1 TL-2023]
MPLVVPDASGAKDDLKSEWMQKLLGKKLTESITDHQSFSKQELPKNHRVLDQDSMTTMDFQPERLNVHVGDDGVVRDVKFG